MPYDDRPISEGGNKGIDETFTRKAPKGKYRVIGVDTFDGGDWVDKDCNTLQEAQTHINNKTRGQQMLIMHIYNDKGKPCGSKGSF